MFLPYFPPDRPDQLVTSLPDDAIQEIVYHTMQNSHVEKENGRTGRQLLR